MATLKPTTPLLASNKGALKPASPLHPKIAPKTPISHPQRRCRFQSRLGRRPQRRWRFQTSGPAGLQGQAAAPMGGGEAWPDRETTRQTRPQHTRPNWCGGRRRDLPRCRWAVAGPGRASRRRAERSSQRGRLAGGPPPTGTHSGRGLRRPEHPWVHTAARPSRARTAARPSGRALRRPEHQRCNMPPRHNKTARPHRGRAAQSVSKAQRRITTMSGSPRPLSWRTLEIPSLAATSFAVPSMRGSS